MVFSSTINTVTKNVTAISPTGKSFDITNYKASGGAAVGDALMNVSGVSIAVNNTSNSYSFLKKYRLSDSFIYIDQNSGVFDISGDKTYLVSHTQDLVYSTLSGEISLGSYSSGKGNVNSNNYYHRSGGEWSAVSLDDSSTTFVYDSTVTSPSNSFTSFHGSPFSGESAYNYIKRVLSTSGIVFTTLTTNTIDDSWVWWWFFFIIFPALICWAFWFE
jgi:hypothetical protein